MGPTRRQIELARERETFRFVAPPTFIDHHKTKLTIALLQIRSDLDIELKTQLADKPHPFRRTHNLIRHNLDGVLPAYSPTPKYRSIPNFSFRSFQSIRRRRSYTTYPSTAHIQNKRRRSWPLALRNPFSSFIRSLRTGHQCSGPRIITTTSEYWRRTSIDDYK